MLGAVGFGGAGVDELAAALGQVRQLLLGRGNGRRGGGLEGAPISGEDGRVDGIGFGALALGAGEVPDATRFEQTDGNIRRLEGTHDRLFVTAGGFADHMCVGMGAQELKQLRVSLGVIGQGVRTTCEM